MTPSSLLLLRLTFAGLFAWFGFSQVSDPGGWTAFLPEYTGYLPIPAEMLIQVNGWFELCAALALLLGVWTRVLAAFLALHLFGIAFTVGGAIGARDAALGMIGVILAMQPADLWTMDARFKPQTPLL